MFTYKETMADFDEVTLELFRAILRDRPKKASLLHFAKFLREVSDTISVFALDGKHRDITDFVRKEWAVYLDERGDDLE